jgi:hypothetical protein
MILRQLWATSFRYPVSCQIELFGTEEVEKLYPSQVLRALHVNQLLESAFQCGHLVPSGRGSREQFVEIELPSHRIWLSRVALAKNSFLSDFLLKRSS